MVSLFYVTVALPFGLFYAETDEEKEFVSETSTSLIDFFLYRNGAYAQLSRTR